MRPGLADNVRGLGLPDALTRLLEDLQRAAREARGDGLAENDTERLVRRGDLIQWGMATEGDAGLVPTTTQGSFAYAAVDLTPPSAPTALIVNGGYSAILLKWSAAVEERRAYFEVWRSGFNLLSTAVKIAQTTSALYADEVQNATNYYYWIRAVSQAGVFSGYNQMAGTSGQTAPDLDYALGVLTGSDPSQPFYFLAAPQVVGGVSLPSGTYMKQAFIRDAVVRYFRAGEAIIDSASIIELDAAKINAGAMSADRIDTVSLVAKHATFTTTQIQSMYANKAFINSANIDDHLQSNNFNGNPGANSPGSAGWYIGKDGKFYANSAYFSGDVSASTISGSNINGGTVSGTTINGGTINGTTVFAGGLRSSGFMAGYATPLGSRQGFVSGYQHYWDLNATGTQLAFHINGRFRVYADGLTEIDSPVIFKPNVVASGIKSNAAGLCQWGGAGGGGGGIGDGE